MRRHIMTSGNFSSNSSVDTPVKKGPSKNVKIVVGVVAIIVIIAVISSVVSSCGNAISNIPSSGDLVILEHHATTTEFGTYEVVGTAKNTGTSSMSYAEVDVKFYDAGGTLLDTWIDNINNLGAGETWSFEVMYTGSKTVATYTIAPGSSW
jgi:hypothetical protein